MNAEEDDRLEQLLLKYRILAAQPPKERIVSHERPAVLCWRTGILVAAAIVCAGAIAATVGVRIRQYYFEGRGADGNYYFHTEDSKATYRDANGVEKPVIGKTFGEVILKSKDPNRAVDVERTQKDLEEVDLLRQQDRRELVGVVDVKATGCLFRTLVYKYTLSDGRTMTIRENELPLASRRTPDQMQKDREEVARLRQQERRELVGVMDTQMESNLFRVCQYKYVLADGRELTFTESDPELPPPTWVPGSEQISEIWRLRRLKQGEFLGYHDRQILGKTITFETYVFTLSDGMKVTHSVGEVKGQRINLTDADREELRRLREANRGEDLGVEVSEVKGRTFSFRRERFILSDGTEVIQSRGEPTGSR